MRTDTEVLYELTSAMSRGEALESIYERAFEALRETLGARRSSVLLLDERGVMRFEAWRDLSAEYREAVEGHSPWARGETDWQPLVVRDIEADESWSSYRELFGAENIRSLGFLPIVLGQKLLGKFMVYYEEPHEFSDRDINIARTITAHIATAIARDRADRKLHASEERLRLAVDAARVGTWDYDLESGVLELDRWARAMFTMPPDIKPGLERLLRHVHPADRVRTNTAMQNALAPGSGGEYDVEYRAIGQRNAEERWIAARGKVLFDERGCARRFIGTFRDVTDAKRDALERERILADLANAVRFGELLMGIVAHDLRSPLAVIISATELAMMRSESDRLRVPLERARASGNRMARMIDQLLDLTRIRLGTGIPIERTDMDIGQICTAIAEELRSSHEGLAIEVELSGDLTGQWDPDRLAQLVSNLGGNACAHGKPPIVIFADGRSEREVLIKVENRGAIRPEVVPTLFEPWTRRRGADGSGLGLGLYISREIARLHAGSIEMGAADPDSTCFVVRLPRHPLQ